MVSEEYSSTTNQTETPVGASSHLSKIPPLCNIQQDEGVKESSQLETPNWKRRQRSLVYNASNWDRTLPSVSSTERFSSAAVDTVTMGDLFVDFDSLKVSVSSSCCANEINEMSFSHFFYSLLRWIPAKECCKRVMMMHVASKYLL